ncbi:MAG: hypothetical protein ACKO2P_01480 [Planctomycetota bacterium]
MPSQSHAQKRKAKLKKRVEKKPRISRPEPYFGTHWRADADCALFMMQTESGISAAWQISSKDAPICDDDVVEAIESLIVLLRAGKRLLPSSGESFSEIPVDTKADMIVQLILKFWEMHRKDHTLPGRDDVIGVLRSVLGSISKVRVDRPGSTRYLQFVTEWLRDEYGFEVTERPAVEFDGAEDDGPVSESREVA